MYVVELDRPWLGTPFLVQGFIVRSVEELQLLSELCDFVFVDAGRSKAYHKPTIQPPVTKERISRKNLGRILNVDIADYVDTTSMNDELISANRVFSDFEAVVSDFIG